MFRGQLPQDSKQNCKYRAVEIPTVGTLWFQLVVGRASSGIEFHLPDRVAGLLKKTEVYLSPLKQ